MLACLLLLLGGAMIGAAVAKRSGRRGLNQAVHELRRPLQALALAPSDEAAADWLSQAGAALESLEHRINGGPVVLDRGRTSTADLLDSARRRWGPIAEIEVEPVRDRRLIADPVAVGSALDNLIANALEHGSGPIRVRAGGPAGRLRLQVLSGPAAQDRRAGRADPRHGHGLRVASEVAARHGGRLQPPLERDGAVRAALELPLTPAR